MRGRGTRYGRSCCGSSQRGDDEGMTDDCPDCGHPRILTPRWLAPVRQWFGMRPVPAECTVSDGGLNPSGWPEPCGCTAPAHGS